MSDPVGFISKDSLASLVAGRRHWAQVCADGEYVGAVPLFDHRADHDYHRIARVQSAKLQIALERVGYLQDALKKALLDIPGGQLGWHVPRAKSLCEPLTFSEFDAVADQLPTPTPETSRIEHSPKGGPQ